MQLHQITARSHPFGNRMVLSWENRSPDVYPGVRVVRRTGTHPLTPDDGLLVAEMQALLFSAGLGAVPDLDSGTLPPSLLNDFAASGHSLAYDARIAVETPGVKWLITDADREFIIVNTGAELRAHKKGLETVSDAPLKSETIYYYTLFPFRGDPPEFAIDRRNRVSAMATGPYDAAGQMYGHLPRIYLRYDTQQSALVAPEDRDKGVLRRFLEVTGSQLDLLQSFAKGLHTLSSVNDIEGSLLPLLAQWIGWNTDYSIEIAGQRNQIIHAPALYKTTGLIPPVEAAVKRMSGWESRTKEFVHNVCSSNRPERLYFRAMIRDSALAWSEPVAPVSLDYAYDGRPAVVQDDSGTLWCFYHTHKKRQWQQDSTSRDVYNIWFKTHDAAKGWSSSAPLVSRIGIDKHPSAVMHGGSMWVFWSVFDEAAGKWRIEYRTRTADQWGPVEPFDQGSAEQKMPLAVMEGSGGRWLFWLERAGTRWVMKYNRHDGAGWQLSAAADFPMDGEMIDEPFALFNPSAAGPPLFLFWAKKEPGPEPWKTRWSIAYRFKQSLDPAVDDWSTCRAIPKAPDADYHDREPAAGIREGRVELFWSSNRNGSWSIWYDRLADPDANTWEGTMQATAGPYSQRDPLPVARGGETLLLYRSNERMVYQSSVYRSTETTDLRYAGSTVPDTRNTGKIELRGTFDDFQTYTHDTGRTEEDWYARDTIGIHLEPDTMDEDKIKAGVDRIKIVLDEFMPITDRAVFITERMLHTEHVYTYGLPLGEAARTIYESYRDTLESVTVESVPGPGEG